MHTSQTVGKVDSLPDFLNNSVLQRAHLIIGIAYLVLS